MNFLTLSLPMGRFAGISVRLHFTFFLYAFLRITQAEPGKHFDQAIFLFILYISVLLHEFGHSLAARWCDGRSDLIILWPLGGLAFCKPLFNPTAHLITSSAGPLVTLALFLMFLLLHLMGAGALISQPLLGDIISDMVSINFFLLIFNLIPAFPMDGGRILRDSLWHFTTVERATKIAASIGKLLAMIGFIFGLYNRSYMLALISSFIFLQASIEHKSLPWEGPVQPFSILERLRRKKFQTSSLPPRFSD